MVLTQMLISLHCKFRFILKNELKITVLRIRIFCDLFSKNFFMKIELHVCQTVARYSQTCQKAASMCALTETPALAVTYRRPHTLSHTPRHTCSHVLHNRPPIQPWIEFPRLSVCVSVIVKGVDPPPPTLFKRYLCTHTQV